ncbi:MAG: hypothetical protein D6730_18360 [Bacteroidetes bacterium]|nr:MAG: hypothetical protein D6730_18360 [Bacteroidota bacterium]
MSQNEHIFSPETRRIIAEFSQFQSGDWLRECAIRKQDLKRNEYLAWLQQVREQSFKGYAQSEAGSPAHAYHHFRLKLIRQEMQEAESETEVPLEKHRIRKNVMRHIMEGRLEMALKQTYHFLEKQKELEAFQYELIHLLSEFNHYEEKERKGMLKHEQLSLARNRIRNALLHIIKEIGKEE